MRKRRLLTEAEKKKRQRANLARWRKLHPDYGREWRKKNKKKVRAYKRDWRSRPANVKREAALAQARASRSTRP